MSVIDLISGRAIPVRGNDVDTDRIIPARFLRSTSFEGLEDHVFEDDRKAAGDRHPFSNPAFQGAAILLVNANFACGSSREHAPQALYRWGIRAVVGESFSEIFLGNSTTIGLPCFAVSRADAGSLMALVEREPATIVTASVSDQTVRAGSLTCAAAINPASRRAFLDGLWDPTALLLDRFDEVRAVASRLPYVSWAIGR